MRSYHTNRKKMPRHFAVGSIMAYEAARGGRLDQAAIAEFQETISQRPSMSACISARQSRRALSVKAFSRKAFSRKAFFRKTLKALFLLATSFIMMIAREGAMATAHAQSFTVTSPGSADGALLTRRNAASAGDCGGENISPPIAWSHTPPGTLSHAIVMYDPDGGKGLGSVHWVAYDIAPSSGALEEGAGTAESGRFVGGTNHQGHHDLCRSMPTGRRPASPLCLQRLCARSPAREPRPGIDAGRIPPGDSRPYPRGVKHRAALCPLSARR